MWKEFKEKEEVPRLVCEGPVEPSHTSSGHRSALKHTTTTLNFKMMDTGKGSSHKESGGAALKVEFGKV